MKRNLWFGLAVVFGVAALLMLVLPEIAQAAIDISATKPDSSPFGTIEDVIKRVFDVTIAIGAVIFLINFLTGGITYLTGAGTPETVTKAKQTMTNSIVGLLLTLAAWALANWIYGAITSGDVGSIGQGGGSGSSQTGTGNPQDCQNLPLPGEDCPPSTAPTTTGGFPIDETEPLSPTPVIGDDPTPVPPTPVPITTTSGSTSF